MLMLHTVSSWWMEVTFDLQESLQEAAKESSKNATESKFSSFFFRSGLTTRGQQLIGPRRTGITHSLVVAGGVALSPRSPVKRREQRSSRGFLSPLSSSAHKSSAPIRAPRTLGYVLLLSLSVSIEFISTVPEHKERIKRTERRHPPTNGLKVELIQLLVCIF